MAAKNADPLTNPMGFEMGAQEWGNTCGVCHVGGGQLEYNRDLEAYGSAGEGGGDSFVMKYARPDDPNTGLDETSWDNVTIGSMSATNKAEMDCLMCHLDGSNPGSAWLKTLGCDGSNPIGPMNDPTCSGTSMFPGLRTVDNGTGVQNYDMFNRNFGLKQRRLDLIASMGAGAKGVFSDADADGDIDDLTSVDWGTSSVVLDGSRIAATPKSENCSVCHARDDNTMGLPGMMAMRTGYGNYGLIHDPSNPMPSGNMGASSDLDTDNGAGAVNNDYWFDFGCKTGMGKRAHKITATGDEYGTNGRWGMSMFMPSTLDMNPATVPNAGDPILDANGNPAKMPDIDVHDRNGMECATCHYAVGSTTGTGYEDIPSKEAHGFVYPAERVFAMDHQFAQADSFPDTKGKNNLDSKIRCESCHTDRDNPKLTDNGGTLVAPMPLHNGLPQLHLDKIGCVTCHVPETYSAPGRLKYRDWTAGFARGTFRNTLDWNFDLVTGSHNPVPSVRKWVTKNGERKIYPILPSLLPTWFEVVPNSGVLAKDDANMLATDHDYLADGDMSNILEAAATGAMFVSPVKNRDLQKVAEFVRDNNPQFDMRLNGGNTVPLFDGFQIVDSWEIDTEAEINAMLGAFQNQENGSDARFVKFLNVVQADFDVTHGVVPKEWALGGEKRGGCVSCHSSKVAALPNPAWDPSDNDPAMMVPNPNYSPYSVGFFEGYVQPVANAGMPGFGVGGYEIVKNWMAMFADFDAAAMCGAGDPTKMADNPMTQANDPDHHTFYFNPMTGKPAMTAECASWSWFSDNPMFGTGDGIPNNGVGGNAQLQHVVGMMTTTFDQAMGFPSGTAMQMGMYDGVAGIQGFALKELQTSGTLGCNPFAGPISFSPAAGQSVNACLPNYADPTVAAAVPGAAMYAGMINGTCVGANPANGVPGACSGGFRDTGACMADADCQGAMTDLAEIGHNPMGLMLSRQEAVSHFKIDLQQSYNADGSPKVKWAVSGEQNPSNPSHVAAWDQAQYCYDYMGGPNPMQPAVVPCNSAEATRMDGKRHIATAMSANQFLGYPAQTVSMLMSPSVAVAAPTYKVDAMLSALPSTEVDLTVQYNATRSTCASVVDGALTPWALGCSYSWNTPETSSVTDVSSGVRDAVYPAEGEYSGTVTVCLNDDPATQADESSVCDSETVAVSAVVVEPEVLGVDFTSAVVGKTVTLQGLNLDASIARAYIYWGDRKSSSVTAAQLAAGVAHTYTIGGKSYDISVKVIAADYSQTVYAVGDDGDLHVTLP